MLKSVADIVANKSVALVGNSERILREKSGVQIDCHDVVVRINRGLPHVANKRAIGDRTTIWATAKYWSDLKVPVDCEAILWMKLTVLGREQYKLAYLHYRHTPLIQWSQAHEDACREYVGADPGTGIRLLWWLRMHTQMRSVSCYGMDCWEAPSYWSGKTCTPNHSPDLERQAMLRLL